MKHCNVQTNRVRPSGDGFFDYLRTSQDCTVINKSQLSMMCLSVGICVCDTDSIQWYNHMWRTTTENKRRMVDTSNLMRRYVLTISSQSSKLEWTSSTKASTHNMKQIRRVIERINYILDTIPTEYTQQAFTHAPGIFHRMCSMQVSKAAWW